MIIGEIIINNKTVNAGAEYKNRIREASLKAMKPKKWNIS